MLAARPPAIKSAMAASVAANCGEFRGPGGRQTERTQRLEAQVPGRLGPRYARAGRLTQNLSVDGLAANAAAAGPPADPPGSSRQALRGPARAYAPSPVDGHRRWSTPMSSRNSATRRAALLTCSHPWRLAAQTGSAIPRAAPSDGLSVCRLLIGNFPSSNRQSVNPRSPITNP